MSEAQSTPKRSRFKLIALVAIPLVAIAGGLVYAHQNGGHGHMSGEAMEHHLDHLDSILTKIGASDAQKSQIDATMRAAFANMNGLREGHHAAFGQFHELLFAPTIDRARIESMRAEQIKSFDDASKSIVTAFEDAAEVLSPDQRKALAEEIRKHHAH